MYKSDNNYKREFASFSGKCPYACLHCYTYIPEYNIIGGYSISKVVNSLNGKNPDIIYISGHKENFINPEKGLRLCEALFDNYHCDIMITTRNVFSIQELNQLKKLNEKIKTENHYLFFCSSIPALESYQKLENNPLIPTPWQRMNFLKEVYNLEIDTFLTIKPLCPNEFIPINEALEIIDTCKDYTTSVLSSGIVVDKNILNRLKNFPTNFKCTEKPLMECLENNIMVQYVNVDNELTQINNLCEQYNIPFFQHSMPAFQYIKSLKKH